MFKFQGMWLPDGEQHFPDWMKRNGEIVNGRGTYQIKKFREAMKHVRQFRTAIDVGAHVGFWSIQMAQRFEEVKAFEPIKEFRECFRTNLSSIENLHLFEQALGAEQGVVCIAYDPADSGGTHVAKTGREAVVNTLDWYAFTAVDFIKIDCEGYELEVLKGARETIEGNKPTIIVEQKPHKLEANYGTKGAPAVEYLKAMGYTVAREMSGDYIMVPK